MYTIEKAIQYAHEEVERKISTNLLFKSDVDLDALDWSKGDPETLYSIASLYAQGVKMYKFDAAVDMIERALEETYPEYM